MTTATIEREERARALLQRRGYILHRNGIRDDGEPRFNILDNDGMPVKGLVTECDEALYAVDLTLDLGRG